MTGSALPVLRRLVRFLRPFWPQVALSVVLGAATVTGGIGLLATSAYLIAAAALQPSIAELQVVIVGVRFFGLTRGVFRYLERLVSHDLNFRLLAQLRVWFYAALEPLAPARLWQQRSGDLLSRAVADVETLKEFYGRALAPPLVALVVTAGAALFVGRFVPAAAWALAGALTLAGLLIPWALYRPGRKAGAQLVAARAALYAQAVDGIQGAAELLAFNQEAEQLARLRAAERALARAQARQAWLTGVTEAVAAWLPTATVALVLALSIPAVRAGHLEGVLLAVLALIALSAFEAVTPLPQAAQQLGSCIEAAGRLLEVVEVPPAVAPVPPLNLPALPRCDLEVRDLTFRYGPELPPALAGLSFTLPQGGRLAIVGPSGAGKSTLVHLLLRFWEYEQGEIRLGGRSLREYDRATLSRLIAVVSQRTDLFTGTIRDNLRLARPDADDSALRRAARQAQLHEFIQGLPEGYDTWIGEQGWRLSGGERQRLAIARALLQDAPLLLLDEPTAHLDTVTERQVLAAIETLMAGRTTLRISHRLVGMEAMDEILVLQAGRVVERGPHAALLRQGGLYARLWAANCNGE